MRKLLKSVKFVGVSREGAGSGLGFHFGWILRLFWKHLVPKIGKKAIQKPYRKIMETKRRGKFREIRLRAGGPSKLFNHVHQRTPVDILSFHFVPQGHGGGYEMNKKLLMCFA